MTPEQLLRLRTYDPNFDWPGDDDPDQHPHEFPNERVKWRGAIVFGHLAALAIGVGIGLALNP